MIGMKQSVLASNTGYSQQYISKLEQSESFADEVLEKIATGMGVSPELIKNFDEEKAVNIISNTFNDHAILNGINYNPTFNPLDELKTALDENRRLYEALLQSEREKIALLEKMLGNKRNGG